jgi:hypothetical protein
MRGIVSTATARRSTSFALSRPSYYILARLWLVKASFDTPHTSISTRPQGNVDFVTTQNKEYCDLTMNVGQSLRPWSRTATTTVLFCFPVFYPPEVANMNYVSVVIASVIVIIAFFWFTGRGRLLLDR